MSDNQPLASRAARAHLASVNTQHEQTIATITDVATITDLASVRGGGPSFLAPAQALDPSHPQEPQATPRPPKRPHPEFPSASVADIHKKFPEKNVATQQRRCGNCFYYLHATCRAEPPKLHGLLGVWPIVQAEQWCGDWLDISIREGVLS